MRVKPVFSVTIMFSLVLALLSGCGGGGSGSPGVTTPPPPDPVLSTPPLNKSVFVESTSACATTPSNELKCWGTNYSGVLGLETSATTIGRNLNEMGYQLPAVNLGTDFSVAQLSGSYLTHCALSKMGQVKCWGNNASGQLGYGDTVTRGDDPGEMGNMLDTVDLGTGRTGKQIAGYGDTQCALLDDNSVKCWGANDYGVLGQGDTDYRGDNPSEMGDNLPPIDLAMDKPIIQIAVGWTHACALASNGKVKCWGSNFSGELGYGDTEHRGDAPGEMGDNLPYVDLGTNVYAVELSLGPYHSCARLNTGEVKCWGGNFNGQLGQEHANNLGDGPGEMGDNLLPVKLGTGHTAMRIAAGEENTCAILDDGAAKCWGQNNHGTLGLGDTVNRGDLPGTMGDDLPEIDLGTGRTVMEIDISYDNTCAYLDDGAIKCWGLHPGTGTSFDPYFGDIPGEMGDNLPAVNLGFDVVINEIMGQPVGIAASDGQWFEVVNRNSFAVDLYGCWVTDQGSTNRFQIDRSLLIEPNGIVTLASGAMPGFTPDFIYSSGDFDLNAASISALYLNCQDTEIDAVPYPLSFILTNGVSLSLDASASNTPADNDNPLNWCNATSSYGSNLGTPGSENDACH